MRMKLLLIFAVSAFQAAALQVNRVTTPAANGYIKVFVQPMLSETDLLLVVDDSGSMSSHQSQLARNIPVLAQALTTKGGSSLHAAVLTTDMDGMWGNHPAKGQFRKILNSSHPNFTHELAQAMLVGTNGSGIEQHFAAVTASLSSPLIENQNAGFLRPSAHLSVIFVTDAEDQSPQIATEMTDFLTRLKGAGGVSAYAFLSRSGDTACAKDGFENPVKIETLVQNLGGQIFNLCDADWQTPMLSIADKMIIEITRTIRLPTEPVRRTIEVRFGSQILVGGDLRRGWVYDESNNSIVLGDLVELSHQPAGTELEIKFVPKYWQK